MCGICGEVGFRYGYNVDPWLIKRMCDSLAHRGPDEEGQFVHEMVGLGQRRLSIIDLNTGKQPISNEDGSIWVVLNGEIYNFVSLRQELISKGHAFSTNTDTEVIVHLYEEYGVKSIKRLRGMFGFALWDNKDRLLLLGRDRLGKKPLFYAQLSESLLFASETKALFQDSRLKKTLNQEAIHDFLSFKFIPRQEDLYKGVFKLPPASYMIFREGQATIHKYWDLHYKTDFNMSEEDALVECERVLTESVRLRMMSDVPIGAFLSSGIDSGMIVALMSQLSHDSVNSFSIGDETQDFNELPMAAVIAEKFETNHREFLVRPDAIKILPDLIYHLDGPFADVPALPMYYVAKMASEHVKVVLTGDGGDESFGGYDRYLANQLLVHYRKIPRSFRQKLIPNFLNLFNEKTARKSWRQSLRWFNTLSMLPDDESYGRGISFFSFEEDQKKKLYTSDFQSQLEGVDSLEQIMSRFHSRKSDAPLNKMTFCDLMIRVPEYSCIKIDRITMMHGLEARSPFLDHKLVEFAATIPPSLKLKKARLKYLLKEVGKKYLPKEIIALPKQGFGSPINTWLRGELRGFSNHLLRDESMLVEHNIFRQNYINSLLDGHTSKKVNDGNRIWSLVNLEIWYRLNFGDKDPVTERDNLKDRFISLSINR